MYLFADISKLNFLNNQDILVLFMVLFIFLHKVDCELLFNGKFPIWPLLIDRILQQLECIQQGCSYDMKFTEGGIKLFGQFVYLSLFLLLVFIALWFFYLFYVSWQHSLDLEHIMRFISLVFYRLELDLIDKAVTRLLILILTFFCGIVKG